MLLLAEEYKLDPERVVVDILEIAEVKGIDINILLLTSHLMKHKNVNVFDAFHASFCGKDEIISSDSVFDKLGLKRISLER
jgi:predicted nucleic acid-binding protein